MISPQAPDIEAAVLGCMINATDSLVIGMDMLNRESFYLEKNQVIFDQIHRLSQSERQIEITTIVQKLHDSGKTELAGGIKYLTSLISHHSHAAFESHCLILKEKQTSRAQLKFGNELISMAEASTSDPFDVNTFMVDTVNDIQNITTLTKEISNHQLAVDLIGHIEEAARSKGLTGVPAGFIEQDQLTGGWQKGDMIVLAARPGMGKTAKALNDCLNMAKADKRVIYFSLEMPARQLFKRLVSIVSEIPLESINKGTLSEKDWQRFHGTIDELTGNNIVFVDDCRSIKDITLRIKRERMKHNVDCVYIDLLTLIKGDGDTYQRVSNNSRGLKQLALSEDLPIVVLHQLSRLVEQRGGDKIPQLADLRDSGAIEEDADIVTFLYRPEYYGIAELSDGTITDGIAYLMFKKHRNGMLKDIRMTFHKTLTKFSDYSFENW